MRMCGVKMGISLSKESPFASQPRGRSLAGFLTGRRPVYVLRRGSRNAIRTVATTIFCAASLVNLLQPNHFATSLMHSDPARQDLSQWPQDQPGWFRQVVDPPAPPHNDKQTCQWRSKRRDVEGNRRMGL